MSYESLLDEVEELAKENLIPTLDLEDYINTFNRHPERLERTFRKLEEFIEKEVKSDEQSKIIQDYFINLRGNYRIHSGTGDHCTLEALFYGMAIGATASAIYGDGNLGVIITTSLTGLGMQMAHYQLNNLFPNLKWLESVQAQMERKEMKKRTLKALTSSL